MVRRHPDGPYVWRVLRAHPSCVKKRETGAFTLLRKPGDGGN
ncbi:Protein of unknown function [Pyronema omphalodes CBS 100304]|uniref:Uncharacterized protein n=1 Tax=Pyronema omphalodes (strain CBS 100304) TaxID=1076935 RepID=U4LII8_PYROM|nr:Protein of unknown function [Pyronema omphalodes CBS 100304]